MTSQKNASQPDQTPATTTDRANTATARVERALEAASNTYGLLGKLISWRVYTHIAAPLTLLRDLLNEVGLGEVKLPKPTETSAFNKALKRLQESGRVVEVEATRERIVYALVQDEIVSADSADEAEVARVQARERYKVVWYLNGVPDALRAYQTSLEPALYFVDDQLDTTGEAEAKIAPLIKQWRTCYDARGITEHICKAVTLDLASGIPFHDRGVFYFVHKDYLERVEQLRAFLTRLGEETKSGCWMRATFVPDIDTERMDLGAAALEALLSELEAVESDLTQAEARDAAAAAEAAALDPTDARAIAAQARADTMRNNSMAAKEAAVERVLAKAALLAQVSDLTVADVRTKAEALRRKAAGLKRGAAGATDTERGERLEVAGAQQTTLEEQMERAERLETVEAGGSTSPRAAKATQTQADLRIERE